MNTPSEFLSLFAPAGNRDVANELDLLDMVDENEQYEIRIAESSLPLEGNAKAYLLNEGGEKVLILDRVSASSFVFKTLPKEQFESLALQTEEDRALGTYEIFGQLYSKLSN